MKKSETFYIYMKLRQEGGMLEFLLPETVGDLKGMAPVTRK
jgi:hypothetical protein